MTAAARRPALAGAVLVAAVVLAYLPALRAGFVWDDRALLESGVVDAPDGLRRIWTEPSALGRFEDHIWPLVYTTFWIEHRLFGFRPAVFHATNLALHLLCVLLLWRIAERLRVPGAGWAAALFALHPVHVESVAWIIERKDVLSGACALGSAAAFLRWRDGAGRSWWALSAVLLAAGLLAKSVVVTLPAALLLAAWWRSERIRRRDVAAVAPLFLIAAAIAGADFLSVRETAPVDFALTPAERVGIAARALLFYAGRLAWPAPSPVIWPRWNDPAGPAAWISLAGVAAAAGTLWLARRRLGRGPAAALLFFALTLAPTLGLIDFSYMRYSFVADRFQYLASAGPLLLVAAAGARVARRAPRPFGAAALAGLIVLGALTWRQAEPWSSDERLFRHILARNPDAPDAWHNLGSALVKEPGRLDEAIACFRRAVAARPDDARSRYDLGTALLHRGDADGARRHLEAAVRLAPDDADAHGNLGILLARTGHPDEAERSLRRAVELRPDDPALLANLARLLEDQGRTEEAEAAYRAAARRGHAGAAERLRNGLR